MDVVIQTPAEASADFKRSLQRFLVSRSFVNDEGFTIHWSEPRGDAVIQHLHFENAEIAEAFQLCWRGDVFERD
ncbi:MAG: hypothetical protein P4L64_04540 [Caulobacteraceae bacterium]|nr:hypothetical protein [Caulobacteraceae bacterium]